MKKIYILCLLLCVSLASFCTTTTTIWATGGSASYTTGSAFYTPPSTYTRSDGTICITTPGGSLQKQSGYAVFDLSSIPWSPTLVVSSVTIGVCVVGITSGSFDVCNTVGYHNDLSTVTTPSALYGYCTGATAGSGRSTLFASTATITSPGSFGSSTGVITFTGGATSNIATFVATYAGTKVSVGFSGGGTWVYNFRGETGSPVTSGLDAAPFMTITYCDKPSSVVANASATTLCAGRLDTLSGSAVGATSYRWDGPAGYFSGVITTPTVVITTTPTSAGTYTLTAFSSCASNAALTTPITILTSPVSMITPTTTVCSGSTIHLSDNTGAGVWSSSATLSATVSSTGTVTGGAVAGTPTISYTISNGCAATTVITVNNPPNGISGPVTVCEAGGTITLSDGTSGGTWGATPPSAATADPVTGVITGVAAGPASVSYFTGACPTVTYGVTVDPLPSPIVSAIPPTLCDNSSLALSDASSPGTWSVSTTSTGSATIDATTGVISGTSAGVVTATFTQASTSCSITRNFTINTAPTAIVGASQVCVGDTLYLTDLTTSGTWASSNTFAATVTTATGYVTGVTGGISVITYTVPVTACYATQTVTVNILPNPIAPSPAQVCVASLLALNDGITGGTWSSQYTAIATVDTLSGVVTGQSGGVSKITYTLNTGCNATLSVTVNPLPPTTITTSGPTTFCVGGSVVLTAPAGYSYQWYSDGLPTVTTPSYTSTATEKVFVVVSDPVTLCAATSDTLQISLIPAVTITAGGPTTFCQTGNVLLSVPLATGIFYQWKLNGVNLTGGTSNTYAAILDGVYTCDLIVPGGCASTTPGFTVTVHPLPNPLVTYTGTILVTSTGYLSYQWFLNSTAIAGATTTSVVPTTNGLYRVRVTDGNGCTNYSVGYAMNNLAVTQVNKTDIHIYPNPANTVVHIESPVSVRAVITSMDGKTVAENNDAKDINITKLPDGLYMILVYDQDGNRLVVQKLVKE